MREDRKVSWEIVIICSGRYRITADAAIGIMLSLVVKYELLTNNVDIVEAHLNGNLVDDNFMKQPPLFEDSNNLGEVSKLNKPSCRLRQAGRKWNRKKTLVLLETSFKRWQMGNCMYFRRNGDNTNIIALYVDDMIMVSSPLTGINFIVT